MKHLFFLFAFLGNGPTSAGEPSRDVQAKIEYTLQTARSRDPVLGGTRDKVYVSVWIPAGVKTVRGGMCNPFAKGDTVSGHWQAVCRHWNFAYVQTDFDAVKKEEFDLLRKGLIDLAAQTGHPELAHLPLCFTGMSRGGGMSMQLAELLPERTIASVPVCLEVGPKTEATRKIPVCTIVGEKDGSQLAKVLARLPAERKEGAHFAVGVQWGRGHEFFRANNLSFVFLDDVIAARLPQQKESTGPIPLKDIPLEVGWLGDPASWGKDGQRPTIASWNDYKGDRDHACWFPSQRVATVWQAFVAGTNDVTILQPSGLGDKQKFAVQPANKAILVKVAIGTRKPTRVILWDAHQKLAERSEGPWDFEIQLPAGVHSLYATVEEAGGSIRTSKPNTVVVAPQVN